MTEQQPVIAGMFPDPSICRVGDDYFLANSSFEYTPGVPIFHSRDLLTWRHIANALNRTQQLDLDGSPWSIGVCAPTLRHHDGRFWLVTTNNFRIEQGHTIVSADTPSGPWSDPVFTSGVIGIDPDLAWDENGDAFLTWTSFDPRWFGIVQARVNLQTGDLLEQPRQLWQGTGLASPEGPHLVFRDGWWYLIVAEGGTQRGHAVSVARAKSIQGPFEPGPANPILTHRSTHDAVQNTGHADFVERPDGTWAIVFLAVRPRGGGGGFHTNGRETFAAELRWDEGWPVVDETSVRAQPADHTFDDTFDTRELDLRWISPRLPLTSFTTYASPGLRVRPATQHAGVFTRVRDLQWRASIDISCDDDDEARLVLRLGDDHWCSVGLEGGEVIARQQIGTLQVQLGAAPVPASPVIQLHIHTEEVTPVHPALEHEPDVLVLSVGSQGDTVEVGRVEGRYLSTEVAGGFTGRVLGVQATSGQPLLRRFAYQSVVSHS